MKSETASYTVERSSDWPGNVFDVFRYQSPQKCGVV
jgi:hypothetical protein